MNSEKQALLDKYKPVKTVKHLPDKQWNGYTVNVEEVTTVGLTKSQVIAWDMVEPTTGKVTIYKVKFENGDVIDWDDESEGVRYAFTSEHSESLKYGHQDCDGSIFNIILKLRPYLARNHPEFVKTLDKNEWSLFGFWVNDEEDEQKLKEMSAMEPYDEQRYIQECKDMVERDRERAKSMVEKPVKCVFVPYFEDEQKLKEMSAILESQE
jgi:hypothetical protein